MKTVEDCGAWREAIRGWGGEGATGEEASRIQEHLAGCAGCRHYAEELRAAAAGLRWMADQQVESSPGFRARWMGAVEEAAQPRGLPEAAAALAAWWRDWLLRNFKPALGVAALWAVALLLRLSAPEVEPMTQAAVAGSPVEIYRILKAEEQLLAGEPRHDSGIRMAPRNPPPARPRSEGLSTEPSARREQSFTLMADV
jgi:hypothetical protein